MADREWEKQKLTRMAAMGNMAARERLEQLLSEEWNNPPALDPDYVEPPKGETKNNGGLIDRIKDAVLDTAKKDPIKAAEIMEEPIKAVDVLPEIVPKVIDPIVQQGWEDAKKPIWDRQQTKDLLGEDGADKLQDTLNPARWAENAIDDSGVIPDEMKGTVKTILPAVLIGGAALLLITALK